MAVTVQVPNDYGYVILSTIFLHFFTNMYLVYCVMRGRKAFKIDYPNLYATPGYHKDADAFNRIQRGHQHFLETLPFFLFFALLGGLEYPRVVTVASILHALASMFYMAGYSDTKLDVQTARMKKGGFLLPIAFLGVLLPAIASLVVKFFMPLQQK